jgi:hypothetical protein
MILVSSKQIMQNLISKKNKLCRTKYALIIYIHVVQYMRKTEYILKKE